MASNLVHDFDVEIGQVFGLTLYWYGAVYTIGFIGIFVWLWLRRARLGWNRRDAVEFTTSSRSGFL